MADLGERNLLIQACNYAKVQAEVQGLTVKWCRKAEEIVIGNQAVVRVSILVAGVGKFLVTVYFQKSLWSVQAWAVQG